MFLFIGIADETIMTSRINMHIVLKMHGRKTRSSIFTSPLELTFNFFQLALTTGLATVRLGCQAEH